MMGFTSAHWIGDYHPARAIAINWVIPVAALSASMRLIDPVAPNGLLLVLGCLAFLNIWGMFGALASVLAYYKSRFSYERHAVVLERAFYLLCIAFYGVLALIDLLLWSLRLTK